MILENELGGVLRSVEFIFRSSGVNRPLKPDDSRIENLNHTFYRDQINKVANAVKEIIMGLKRFNGKNPVSPSAENPSPSLIVPKRKKEIKINKSFLVLIAIGLMVSGYLAVRQRLSLIMDSLCCMGIGTLPALRVNIKNRLLQIII
jgi:hypothetical protein